MDVRGIRRRCDARLASLVLPQPFAIAAFCEQLAAQRGRPIHLRAMPLTGIAYGICLLSHDADHILYERDTSPFHQQHIILHEVGHLICGHRATTTETIVDPAGLFASMDLGRLQAVLRRASYSASDEREAELLATLIEQRISATAIQQATPLADRLAASFDDGQPQLAAEREDRT